MHLSQSIDIVAVASAIISIFAAIVSVYQANLSRSSFNLQKIIYNDGRANLIIQEIEDSFLHNEKGLDKIYYFLKVTVCNLSDKSTSLIHANLQIIHDNTEYIVHCSNNNKVYSELTKLPIPVNIAPHNSFSGWLEFELLRTIYDSMNIDTHRIQIKDIHGNVASKEEIFIREELIGYDFK